MAAKTLERVKISFIEISKLYSICPVDDDVTPEFMVKCQRYVIRMPFECQVFVFIYINISLNAV